MRVLDAIFYTTDESNALAYWCYARDAASERVFVDAVYSGVL